MVTSVLFTRAAYTLASAPNGLEGDPTPGCVPEPEIKSCSEEAEVQRSVYCSCRCDAPDGYAQCACPDGFSCKSTLALSGDALDGGYCVRNEGR